MINEIRCPECGESEFTMSTEEDKFKYGADPKVVKLSAHIPVHTCTSCAFQFTDYEAEEFRDEAVCQHLGQQS